IVISRAAKIPVVAPTAPPSTRAGSLRLISRSARASSKPRLAPKTVAVHRESAAGCQALASRPIDTTNTPRVIQTPEPPLSPFFLLSRVCLDPGGLADTAECASASLERLMRPHRIFKSLQNRTANRRRAWAPHSAVQHQLYELVYTLFFRPVKAGTGGGDCCKSA